MNYINFSTIFQVNEESTVLDMKVDIEKKSEIPVEHQKILLLGKTLVDDKTIGSYSIKDGCKLTLVVKKPDPLKEVILRQFKKYYQEEQSEKLTKEFMKDFDAKMKQLSLDDLERIAAELLVAKKS